MSVLYLAFETNERQNRLAKLQKSGAHLVVAEPRWPGFFELAKREKPYAIAVDFSHAPSHALETADYLSKAKETRDAVLFLLRVPADRLEAAQKRLPNARLATENELSGRLAEMEKEAEARARQKKEAAAAAKKAARLLAKGIVPEKGKPAVAGKGKAAAALAVKPKTAAAPAVKPKAAAAPTVKTKTATAAPAAKAKAAHAPAHSPAPKKKPAKKPAPPAKKSQPKKKK
jgi:hypothetical protein